jgi:hypothetical protein
LGAPLYKNYLKRMAKKPLIRLTAFLTDDSINAQLPLDRRASHASD